MRFLMAGAGGVGGYFGARLAAAGEDVAFLARGRHLAAMRDRGFRVESPLGDATVHPVRAAEDARELGPADVVFVAVKLPDTGTACNAIAPAVGPDTLVASLQNGVEAEDILVRHFGEGRVAGGVAYIFAHVAAPGVVRHAGAAPRIRLGALGGGADPRIEAAVAALAGAGVEAEAVDDVRRAIWEKFVFLVGLSAATTLTGETIGPIREDPDMRAFLRAAMAEAAAVARAAGVDLPPDDAETRLAFADTLPADVTSSMAHDLAAGKPLEVAWLSGAVARLGAAHGVETPVNATVFAALKPRAGPGPGS